MLELRQLVLRYPEFSLRADLAVAAGAEVAVIGPSGAGKSTLLSVIAGFEDPAQGRVLWQGRDWAGLRPAARPVSMLFQDNNLFPHLSALDNVVLGLAPSGRPSAAARARARAALARVGLAGLEARPPARLSGGQQGRVAIARILVQDHPLILLDEPFAALGPALRQDMLALVRQVARDRGATLILVTHDPQEAQGLPQTILVADGVAQPPMDTSDLFAARPAALRDWIGH